MKLQLVFMVVIHLLLVSCKGDEVEGRVGESISETKVKKSKARVIPDGFVLQWNGDGKWYGFFSGTTVWFYGPSPTQLDNGYQGEWEITCQPTGPCMNDNYTATGNGSFFTVFAPGCVTMSTSSIDMPTMSAIYFGEGPVIPWTVTWGTMTRTVKTFTAGTCSIEANGKIIVNENCRPTIVDYTSSSVSLCPAVYVPLVE